MRVATRLYLTVVPGIIGALAVAGLAYWGRYDYAAPGLLVAVAAAASLVSLAVAARNTRYLAGRIEAMARRHPAARPSAAEDELERIDRNAAEQEAAGRARAEAAEARAREYAGLLGDAAAALQRALEEVRLPLHILLENRFGDLNENQEEMLGAAQDAAEAADAGVRAVAGILAVDAGEVRFRAEPVRVRDLLAPLLPVLRQRAQGGGWRLEIDLSPALPHVSVDAERTREALDVLLRAACDAVEGDASGAMSVTSAADGAGVALAVSPTPEDAARPALRLARRLLAAQGVEAREDDGALRIHLPRIALPVPGASGTA